jgi:hypothetical protein
MENYWHLVLLMDQQFFGMPVVVGEDDQAFKLADLVFGHAASRLTATCW